MSRVLWLIARVLAAPLAGLRGAVEFRRGIGMTYDNDAGARRSAAYDSGRELAHLLTGRRWDQAVEAGPADPGQGRRWEHDEIVEVFLVEDPDTGRTKAFADADQAVEWADLSGIGTGEPAEVIGPELAAEMIAELREQAASDADHG